MELVLGFVLGVAASMAAAAIDRRLAVRFPPAIVSAGYTAPGFETIRITVTGNHRFRAVRVDGTRLRGDVG